MNATQDANYPHITKTVRRDGQIAAKCQVCNETKTYPDKGLGRATYAAWKTHHQH